MHTGLDRYDAPGKHDSVPVAIVLVAIRRLPSLMLFELGTIADAVTETCSMSAVALGMTAAIRQDGTRE